MNEQITDRGTQKRLHTKFYTMNIMRSEARLIKYSISSNIRQTRCGHALSIHESRHSHPSCKKICGRKFENKNTEVQNN